MGVECSAKCKCENCHNGKPGDAAARRQQRLGLAGGAEVELSSELDFPDAHLLLDGVQQQLRSEEPRQPATGGATGGVTSVEVPPPGVGGGGGGGVGGGVGGGGVGGASAREAFHGRELLEMHNLMCSEELAAVTGGVTSVEVLPPAQYLAPAQYATAPSH